MARSWGLVNSDSNAVRKITPGSRNSTSLGAKGLQSRSPRRKWVTSGSVSGLCGQDQWIHLLSDSRSRMGGDLFEDYR